MSLPLSAIPKPVTLYSTVLASGITSSDTSLTLETATDDAGNAITGVVGLTIDGEILIGTKSGATVTGLLRGIDPQDGTSEVTALKAAHQRGATVKITDAPFLAIVYRLLNGDEGLPNQIKYKTSGYPTPVNDYDIPTKKYVDDQVAGTPVSMNRTVVSGTAGETLVAGNLVYLKASDARWWKCDADTAATVDNINLGIAQGAGTAGASVTSGVLVYGRDTNNSGLTAGSTYYASNTAGAISSSAGTTEVTVGQADADGYLFFSPRYNQQLTEDQQDALAGTSGTPSATNKYVTAGDETRNYGTVAYAASSAGSDTYVITLSPVPTAYTTGMRIVFKADVANTGAATLNVNSLGAKSILHIDGTALVDGDIAANSLNTVVYDGTQFLLQSQSAKLVGGASSSAAGLHYHPFASGTTTKNSADASTTQTIAHGLGIAPKCVRITAMIASNGNNYLSKTTYNGTTQSSVSIVNGNAGVPRLNTNFDLNTTADSSADTTGVVTVDATNINIAWTKNGSPTGTYTLLWEASV